MAVVVLLAAAVAWVGHACLLTAALNYLYGCPLPKWLLVPYRYATGAAILAFPLLLASALDYRLTVPDPSVTDPWGRAVLAYAVVCLLFGAVVFPIITVLRLTRKNPPAVIEERSEVVDLRKQVGPAVLGGGKWKWAAHLPLNGCFNVEFTELTLAVPGLPAAWDGLTILLVSDVHLYGSPGRPFFEAVFDRLAAGPTPDLAVLAGDYVDTDKHYDWIAPLAGKLTATSGKFAVLGNHDMAHGPDRIRAELAKGGFDVLGNGWREVTVRGERCVMVGHEGPWFSPGPDLRGAPEGVFRLCVSHTPDNFYWGQRNRVGLMLCGHVHGGQIRVPVVGSIFVPSVYGRRFDMGVFEGNGTVMAVGRGLSGKEPLRYRCRPQVMRITLKPRS
jgi:uncharacterized protein